MWISNSKQSIIINYMFNHHLYQHSLSWTSRSSCNVVCKFLAKVLASILKEVLDKCVSEEQSVFVLRRSIVDNALVVAKIMHYLKCKKAGRKDDVTLKIYISKAIYKINWGYLRAMLLKIVFHDIFVGWIMMHVSSFKFFTWMMILLDPLFLKWALDREILIAILPRTTGPRG